jgi:hypothetical protein
MQNIMTRDEANAEGLTTYFTGRLCKRNHLSNRYVRTGACVECSRFHASANRNKFDRDKRFQCRYMVKLWDKDDLEAIKRLETALNKAREMQLNNSVDATIARIYNRPIHLTPPPVASSHPRPPVPSTPDVALANMGVARPYPKVTEVQDYYGDDE